MSLPSGDTATDVIGCVWRSPGNFRLRRGTSQRVMSPLSPPVASVWPSGDRAMDFTMNNRPSCNDDLLALDKALEQLAQEEPGKVELVKLHFSAGLSLEEDG